MMTSIFVLFQFDNDDGYVEEGYSENTHLEPAVKLEDQNRDHVLLTFQNIISDNLISDKLLKPEKMSPPHDSGENHFCQVCHLAFGTAKTLDAHRKRSHKKFRQSFVHICNDCGMSYEFKNSLVAHIRRKHGPDANKDDMLERSCEVCALVFKGINRLRMHMRRKHGSHEDAFNIVCKYCGLTYDKQCSLLVHIRRKHTHKSKPKANLWLTCPFCAKTFNKRETYARHIQRNHRVREDGDEGQTEEDKFKKDYLNERTGEYACKECPASFSTASYLKWHMKRKHNAEIADFRLKCKICSLSYANSESLKRHVRRKHDKDTYCYDCNRKFPDKQTYLDHSHTKDVKECTICGLIFANQGGLSKHLRCTHKLDSPLTVFCPMCNQGFYSKRQLKPHINRVHLKVTYTCKYCNKVFKTRDVYKRHVTIKHLQSPPEDMETHQCDKCPEKFKDEFDLCKHNNLVHGDDSSIAVIIKKEDSEDIKNVFKCTKCTDEYLTWELLRVHFEQTHHMTEEVQCQICGDLMSRGDLVKHIKVHDEIEVQCQYCEFKSKNRLSMTQHVLRHTQAQTLHCDYPNCRYKSFYEHAMVKHKKRHQELGVKLQCTSCPFQTMNKYILKYHEEAHETGKKRYQCDKCDYATILPANLVQHKYKHSTEKKFKCEVCPFATKYNTSLRFHVKKKHCDLPTLS